MHKKREKVFISLSALDDNKKHYFDRIAAGEIDLYIIAKGYPPFKLSIADIN